jgi:hypothetical protein
MLANSTRLQSLVELNVAKNNIDEVGRFALIASNRYPILLGCSVPQSTIGSYVLFIGRFVAGREGTWLA